MPESAQARATLRNQVAKIASDVATHKEKAAAVALGILRKEVIAFEARGEMPTAAGHSVLLAASGVQANLHLMSGQSSPPVVTTPASTTTTTSTEPPATQPPPTQPPPGDGHHHHKKGNGDGNGGGGN
ncbi:MAG: hypothetical protein ACYDBS_00985 [Acidimicrobiales bacterium]